jgi:hypothetical protein
MTCDPSSVDVAAGDCWSTGFSLVLASALCAVLSCCASSPTDADDGTAFGERWDTAGMSRCVEKWGTGLRSESCPVGIWSYYVNGKCVAVASWHDGGFGASWYLSDPEAVGTVYYASGNCQIQPVGNR